MWIAGAQDEDTWEFNIALRKGLVPHSVRGVHVQNDGVTLIAAVEKTVQGKGTVDNQNSQTLLIPCRSPVDDHVSNRVAETVLAEEPSAQEGKQRPTRELRE